MLRIPRTREATPEEPLGQGLNQGLDQGLDSLEGMRKGAAAASYEGRSCCSHEVEEVQYLPRVVVTEICQDRVAGASLSESPAEDLRHTPAEDPEACIPRGVGNPLDKAQGRTAAGHRTGRAFQVDLLGKALLVGLHMEVEDLKPLEGVV